MTQARFKIVFSGELMPEVALETAQDKLARLFKSDHTRINALFSGRTIALKRNLSEDEADQYLAALHRAGARARKEPEPGVSLSLEDTGEHRFAASAASSDMTCPKCDHRQAKAAECSACGVIIEKFIARQAALSKSTQADQPQQPGDIGRAGNTPYATPLATVAEALPEFGELDVFSIEGRIGRLRYLAWSLMLLLGALALFGLASIGLAISPLVGVILMALVGIGIVVVNVQISVQRLHDIGWSGWLWLINMVPIAGGVFALLMLVIPGTTGANRYGPPAPPNSRGVKVLAWLWLLVPVLGILAAITLPAYQNYLNRTGL
ncbi:MULTISPECIES: DUF805 domain-containing protein [unclassified Pseudomonas]|uniref:DUF805 domain-containing protein n=1 Tax=unclassified Pseudomonas TaxID=196821 RepID=UPI001EDF70C4|nr:MULTISPECIES: DUF805 domain-containing protein [unclassified Pseudomonas]MCG4455539.1 DUF805 domain-containing protein [Pseudomonas sp. MMS21 TM103]